MKNRQREKIRKLVLRIEQLETRDVPTTRLLLDFGGGVGMGNTISITAGNFRSLFGAADTGTNLTNDGYAAGDVLNFTPLNYDFDLDSDTDNDDITALANAVLPMVQRALEPFDIDAVIANATNFTDPATTVGNNAGDATGEFDAYVFVMAVTSTGNGGGSVGAATGLFGEAAILDLAAQSGNTRDEASLTFAENVFASAAGTQGTLGFNQDLAQRLAYTATHEGFHTFSYVHTPDESPPTAGNNARLLASGDVIRRGSVTRGNPFIVTRYDLQHDGAAVPEPNNYLLAANDGDIGLRDSDADGRPDLAYVTGTGAFDRIVLDNIGGGIIDVDVNPFSDLARTTSISVESYNIDLATNTEGTILVDGSINADEISIEGSTGASFRLRGGTGIDNSFSAATETDLLTLLSDGFAGIYTPGAVAGSGTVNYAGGASVSFSEFEQMEADNVAINVKPFTLSSSNLDEGDLFSISVEFENIDTADDHDVRIEWGDGSPDTVFTLGAGVRSFSRNHTFIDDNPTGTPFDIYNVKVTITDDEGDSGTRDTNVTVNNVAPQLGSLVATTTNENGSTTLTGTITDPGVADTFTLTINWGDPLSPNNVQVFVFAAGTTDFSIDHQYLDDNPSGTPTDNYVISLSLTDDDTGIDLDNTVVIVDNVAPVITSHDNSASSETKAEEGELVTVSGTFTDVGTLDTHTVTIDWGDGTITAGTVVQGSGFGSFSGGHAYASGGIFTVTMTLTDDDTLIDTAVETVFITGAGVQTIDGKQVLFVVGSNDGDQVLVQGVGQSSLRVHAGFLAGGKRTFTEVIDEIRMYLCAGDDRGTIAGSVSQRALLDGGIGHDQLNAGGGAAVLIGGAGSDHLNGSSKNDVLIGGTGVDRLVGNGGDDILIGGTTSFDFSGDDNVLANQKSLLMILDEWNETSRTLAQRQANINGTGVGPRLNGTNYLTFGVTVFDDGSADKLTGSSGTDWFFLFTTDNATDLHNFELLN